MSDAINFGDMPVNYGLVHAFDCNTYVDGAEIWNNSISGNTDATVVGANKYVDGSVYFPPNTGFAYWNTPLEKSEITYYVLAKIDSTGTSTGTYRVIFSPCLINSNNIYYLTLSCNDNENIGIWVEDSVKINPGKSFADYCIVAVSQFGGKVRMYYNGELVGTVDGIAHNYTHFGIVNNYCTETPPTKGMPYLNTYVKCVIVANSQHSDTEIQKNSNWLLEQYGLKIPEKDTRLAGTDAVAIAYAIARNQESAAALQEISKSYKDGVREGNDTVVDKTEPIPNDDDEIVIAGGDDDTFPAEFERGGIYIKTKEITVTDDDGNEVTGVFQLQFGLGEMRWTQGYDGRGDWDIPPKVTLTGNGINKTQTFSTGWKGSTSASAPGVKDGNEFWMTEAKIYKSSAKFGGKYYWEYGGGYQSRSWTLSGDFATALRAGDYVSTLPFDDVG